MTKKLITLLLVVASINMFAVDFSFGMTAETAKSYIEEHQNDEKKNDDYSTAQAIVYVSEHSDATFQDIVNLIGKDCAIKTSYEIYLLSGKSAYSEIFSNMFINELNTDFDNLKTSTYFKEVVICNRMQFYKPNNFQELYLAIKGNYTDKELENMIYTTIDKYVDIALAHEYNASINRMICNCLASYKTIYLNCDEETVKTNLKKLNAKSYFLLDVSEEYKTFVTRLRMLYKSLDF